MFVSAYQKISMNFQLVAAVGSFRSLYNSSQHIFFDFWNHFLVILYLIQFFYSTNISIIFVLVKTFYIGFSILLIVRLNLSSLTDEYWRWVWNYLDLLYTTFIIILFWYFIIFVYLSYFEMYDSLFLAFLGVESQLELFPVFSLHSIFLRFNQSFASDRSLM